MVWHGGFQGNVSSWQGQRLYFGRGPEESCVPFEKSDVTTCPLRYNMAVSWKNSIQNSSRAHQPIAGFMRPSKALSGFTPDARKLIFRFFIFFREKMPMWEEVGRKDFLNVSTIISGFILKMPGMRSFRKEMRFAQR